METKNGEELYFGRHKYVWKTLWKMWTTLGGRGKRAVHNGIGHIHGVGQAGVKK